jgi:GNAT superfamily N-acetyltransferase
VNPLTRLRAAFALDSFHWFLGDLPELPGPGDPGCWRLLSQAEAESWVRAHPTERDDQRRSLEVALENEHLLFVASHEGKDVGHVWAARGWMYVERPDCVRVHLAPGTTYFYDMFIDKPYRRRGLAAQGFHFRLHTLRQNGLRRYAAGMNSGNRVGRRNATSMGWPSWQALRFRVGRRAFWIKGRPWERIADRVVTERV